MILWENLLDLIRGPKIFSIQPHWPGLIVTIERADGTRATFRAVRNGDWFDIRGPETSIREGIMIQLACMNANA